jgi:hypothetical protein
MFHGYQTTMTYRAIQNGNLAADDPHAGDRDGSQFITTILLSSIKWRAKAIAQTPPFIKQLRELLTESGVLAKQRYLIVR